MNKERITELKKIAANVRINAITAVHAAASGHPGGSLSIADVLTLLYFEVLNIDPKNPDNPDRDRFVLSKGHCSPALYGVLAERGFFPREDMPTFRKIGSYLQGHPDMKSVPGVDMSSGSLGQGICVANGMALAGKIDNKSYRVYTILGDGELEEGQVWEAAMYAPHYKLDNLTAFVDFNGLQIDGNISEVMSPLPIDDKFRAFGWNVLVCDGHDFEALSTAIESAKNTKGKPTVIILKTVKGKGVSFMENQAGWHGVAPNDEQFEIAIKELNEELSRLSKEA
ncbi:MAG: transketolase [Clostridia bacterium]|nr:transketolase [Clostridia bacterium]